VVLKLISNCSYWVAASIGLIAPIAPEKLFKAFGAMKLP
jgi:hypothetical protein